ncbi:MAG: cell division protein FtsA [Chloroflexi bacterium]|nr:cell division protein FtsA [Chloroflexota bacterium]
MAREGLIAGIDVGTTKVATIVGRTDGAGVQVVGVGVAPSNGLRKGVVVNLDETVRSLRDSVRLAERSSGLRVREANVGITGTHIQSLNNKGLVAVSHRDKPVNANDVQRVLESARSIAVPQDKQMLHLIPRGYTVDGHRGITEPVGMHGFRLDVEAHIILGEVRPIENLVKCVQSVGVEVRSLVLEPLATAEATLTTDEREMGVILADIGGGTTDVAIFRDGGVCHTAVLPVGGNLLSNDISVGLHCPLNAAEELKIKWGVADPEMIKAHDDIVLPSFGAEQTRKVSRVDLAEIINARISELMEMLDTEVQRAGCQGLLSAGLVISGGTANLPGIEAVAADVLKMPVRVGEPRGVQGLADTVGNPAFATGVGLLLWNVQPEGDKETRMINHWSHSGSAWERLARRARWRLKELVRR